MSGDRRIEIDRLLMQALDLDGAERSAFVSAIEDAALRDEVVEMLALCDSDADPLALDAAAAARLIDAAVDEDAPALAAALGFEETPLPERIGGWKILERIGAGGMGEVLKVERIEAGFEQIGAMKLIRSGFAIGEFARRFLQERQILARLSHPGIAGLLDGGRDGQGHPFLVMEYVDGEPIDRWCDAQRLGIDARIDLFIEVGRAVAHAHRSLVIHRDLKPSNILVRKDGRVKLLDFGIAKVLGGDVADDPLATRIEQRMFTPDYASPEQVRGQPVTTTSDVYQLGLLLYELLSGHRAQKIGHNTGPAAVERIVCEQEITRPSQRIGSGDGELAARRHLQPAQLKRRLRGDLDLIVGKALQKAPERRYGTVDELVDDLLRSRQGHTLHARPDTLAYRAQRFARRHPVGLVFASVTLALLGFYLVTLNMQAQALERERDRAQAEASKARQVQGLMQRLFEGIDPDVSGGEPLSVQELLDRSFGQIEGELGEHPEVQAELLLTVGDVYAALGNYPRAEELLTQAMGLVEPLEAEQPLLAARVYRSRGRLLADGNTPMDGEPLIERALAIFRAGGDSETAHVASVLFMLSDLRRRQGMLDAAAVASREALELRRRALPARHPDLAASLNQLAIIDRRTGQLDEAETLLRESIDVLQATLAEGHPRIAEARADLAAVLRSLGRLDESEALFVLAVSGLESARGATHPYLGIVLGNYGNLLLDLGKAEPAWFAHNRALSICRTHYGEVHARTALAHSNLGRALIALARADDAIQSYRQALQALPKSHSQWEIAFRRHLGSLLLDHGDTAEGLAELRTAYEQIPEADRHSLAAATLLRLQAAALIKLGELDAAVELSRRALTELKEIEDSHAEQAETLLVLVKGLVASGRANASISELQAAIGRLQGHAAVPQDLLQEIQAELTRARALAESTQ